MFFGHTSVLELQWYINQADMLADLVYHSYIIMCCIFAVFVGRYITLQKVMSEVI